MICPMTHYYKLAFITFRIIGSLITFYSLLSFGYVSITVQYIWATADPNDGAPLPNTGGVIAKFLPVLFYLLLGLLIIVFSKQLAKLAVKGIDRK